MDFPLHADPQEYVEAVSWIKNDPLSLGALVTTHKIDLLKACRHLFDELDGSAQLLKEVSCISKRGYELIGHAKDTFTSTLALESFLAPDYWEKDPTSLVCLGAGGATVALTSSLLQRDHNCPALIAVSDINQERINEIREIHNSIDHNRKVAYHLINDAGTNDQLVANAPASAVIANGTGMGKDIPGSPVTDKVIFPLNGFAWDYNYRGELDFLQLAEMQRASRNLTAVDGWAYFILGWTQVIAEVFHIDIPTSGAQFEELSKIASKYR